VYIRYDTEVITNMDANCKIMQLDVQNTVTNINAHLHNITI